MVPDSDLPTKTDERYLPTPHYANNEDHERMDAPRRKPQESFADICRNDDVSSAMWLHIQGWSCWFPDRNHRNWIPRQLQEDATSASSLLSLSFPSLALFILEANVHFPAESHEGLYSKKRDYSTGPTWLWGGNVVLCTTCALWFWRGMNVRYGKPCLWEEGGEKIVEPLSGWDASFKCTLP